MGNKCIKKQPRDPIKISFSSSFNFYRKAPIFAHNLKKANLFVFLPKPPLIDGKLCKSNHYRSHPPTLFLTNLPLPFNEKMGDLFAPSLSIS